MSDKTLKLPPATFSAIEVKLAQQDRYLRKAHEAEADAQALLREYCEALGFPPQMQYQYRRGVATVVVIAPDEPKQATDDAT